MDGLKRPAVAATCGRHLHDQAGANTGLGDVLRGLSGLQHPGDAAAMADLVFHDT